MAWILAGHDRHHGPGHTNLQSTQAGEGMFPVVDIDNGHGEGQTFDYEAVKRGDDGSRFQQCHWRIYQRIECYGNGESGFQ